MKIRDISPILFAGAASLLMVASAGAAPLQQDLTIPLRPSPAPDDGPDKSDQDGPGKIPSIRPGTNRLPIKPFRPPVDLVPQSDQATLINSKFAGWGSASDATSGKQVEDDLRGNWVMVDATGRFEGEVVAGRNADFANMNIFLMHMGRLVKQTNVDAEGRFVFNNVRQGAYALTGWGEKAFFSFGLNILANNPRATENIPPNSVKVTAYQNQTTINIDWIRHYAPQVGFRVYGRYPEGEGAKDDPTLYGALGLYNNLPANSPATSISSHVVSRSSDGRLIGRVHQFNSSSGRPVDLRSTKVLLLENDSVVAATASDNYGVFEFEQVPNGSYGVLAAGVDGVGMIGITVDDEADDSNVIDFTLIPAETIGWLNDYATEVAYRRNFAAPRRPKPQNDQAGGCQNCQNQAGGCEKCRRQYLASACSQNGITFEQWQVLGCQSLEGGGSGFGQGRFVQELGKTLRQGIDRLDNFSENAFNNSEATDALLESLNQPAQGQFQGNGFQGNGQSQGGFSPAPTLPSSGSGSRSGSGFQSGSGSRSGSGTR